MPRVLIVDDEDKMRLLLREYLSYSGFESDEAGDGVEAIEAVRAHDYDIVIMDIMMPKLDGIAAVREIRKFSNVPVLFLSARQEEYDKLFSFEVGGDDYVTKPFSPGEVIARLKAILSRFRPTVKRTKLSLDDVTIDFDGRTITVKGEKKQITPKEFGMLAYLIERKGFPVSRSDLIEHVWGVNFKGDIRTVDTHIKMLRNTLGPCQDLVVTVRGIGYKFDA